MRCLHCNKKLSLLKLAKGDDFCSSAHFDAYQFQLSKLAIERLMSVPSVEGPKPPLIIRNQEDRKQEDTSQEDGSREDEPQELASPRDGDLPGTSVHEEILPVAPLSTDQPPPYAPFAIAPLPSYALNPPAPVSNELDPNKPAASARELSFPVQDWASTSLLNLYARLGLAEKTPLNWTSPRNFILAAEGFPTDVIRSSDPRIRALDPSPDFRQVEDLVPGEPAPAFEIAPPAAVAPPVEAFSPINPLAPVDAAPIKPVEPARYVKPISGLPFLIAPSFRERTTLPTALDAAGSIPNPSTLVPVLDAGPRRPDSPGAIARSTVFAVAASHKVHNFTAYWIQSTSELPVLMSLVFPAEQKTRREEWHVSSGLIGLTSTALDTGRQATRPLDFVAPAPMLARPAAAFVDRLDPAQRLKDQSRVRRPILPVRGNFISMSQQPCPEPAGGTSTIAPTPPAPDMRTMKTASLFLAPVDTRPRGREPVFADPSVSAMEFGWRAILAKFPLAEPLSTATWQNQAPHFPLPASIADGPELPAVPIQLLPYEPGCDPQKPAQVPKPLLADRPFRSIARREIDSAASSGARPVPSVALPDLRFSPAHDISTQAELLTSSALPVAFERPFAPASGAIFAQPDLRDVSITRFRHANAPAGKGTVGLCKPSVSWELRLSFAQDPPVAKFLPLREDPILPSAEGWTRLTSLHH